MIHSRGARFSVTTVDVFDGPVVEGESEPVASPGDAGRMNQAIRIFLTDIGEFQQHAINCPRWIKQNFRIEREPDNINSL